MMSAHPGNAESTFQAIPSEIAYNSNLSLYPSLAALAIDGLTYDGSLDFSLWISPSSGEIL